MESIKFEQNNLEKYMFHLNHIVLKIKENVLQGIGNLDALCKLFDLYRTLETYYYAFSDAIQRLRAIPIEIWTQSLIGETPNLDLNETTNYLNRVNSFFNEFCDEIQSLPDLYWHEAPQSAEHVNYDSSKNVKTDPAPTIDIPFRAPFMNRARVQGTKIMDLHSVPEHEGNLNHEINNKEPDAEHRIIKVDKFINSFEDSITELIESDGLQAENDINILGVDLKDLNICMSNELSEEGKIVNGFNKESFVESKGDERTKLETSIEIVDNLTGYSHFTTHESVCRKVFNDLNYSPLNQTGDIFSKTGLSAVCKESRDESDNDKFGSNGIDDSQLINNSNTIQIENISYKTDSNEVCNEMAHQPKPAIGLGILCQTILSENDEFVCSSDDNARLADSKGNSFPYKTELCNEIGDFAIKLELTQATGSENYKFLNTMQANVSSNTESNKFEEIRSEIEITGSEIEGTGSENDEFVSNANDVDPRLADLTANLTHSHFDNILSKTDMYELCNEIEAEPNPAIELESLSEATRTEYKKIGSNGNDDSSRLADSRYNLINNVSCKTKSNELCNDIKGYPKHAIKLGISPENDKFGSNSNDNNPLLANSNARLIDNGSCKTKPNELSIEIEDQLNPAVELETLSEATRFENDKLGTNGKIICDSIGNSEYESYSDAQSNNELSALTNSAIPSIGGIEITLQNVSVQLNSMNEIDGSSNAFFAVIESLAAFEFESPSSSESQCNTLAGEIDVNFNDSMAGHISFNTNSSSDINAELEQDNVVSQEALYNENIRPLLEDVITKVLERISIHQPVDASEFPVDSFYTSLINQWKHVMINNTIDIQLIQAHYANDVLGYCRFITNAADLQAKNLIRFVMVDNEITRIELPLEKLY